MLSALWSVVPDLVFAFLGLLGAGVALGILLACVPGRR